MSSDTYILDALVRHQVMLQRRDDGLYIELKPILTQIQQNVLAQLAKYDAANAPIGLQDMLREVNSMIAEAMKQLKVKARASTIDVAKYEAEFTGKMLTSATSATIASPSEQSIAVAAATTTITNEITAGVITTLTIDQVLDRLDESIRKQVATAIQTGMMQNQTLDKIAKSVMQVGQTSARNAETVSRTIINATTNAARSAVYAQNRDVIDGEVWISTLDARTTAICQARDGTVYAVGVGPRPPAHYSCRSVMGVKVNEKYKISNVGVGAKRASLDGPVSTSTTYQSWLSNQPASFQDEVLGATRGKLFRDGGLKLDKFVDESGKRYTLEELKAMEPLAFERANIDS